MDSIGLHSFAVEIFEIVEVVIGSWLKRWERRSERGWLKSMISVNIRDMSDICDAKKIHVMLGEGRFVWERNHESLM